MAIDLKKILDSMKKTHSFKVKIACEIKDTDFKSFDTIMELKGMIKRSEPEVLPLAGVQAAFPRLKEYFGPVYQMEMEFEYPITENQIRTELCDYLDMDRAFVIVRTAESPLEKEFEEDYLDYNEDDYLADMLDEYDPNEYNEEMVKALQSKEAQEHQQHFEEFKE